MTRFSRGMTLVSVLVAVALLGILAAVMVTIFSQMTNTMVRANVSSEGQNIVRFAQSILSQKYLCDYAMHTAVFNAAVNSTPDVVWNFTGGLPVPPAPVNHLEINPGGVGGASRSLAMTVGDNVTPQLILQQMYLRLPDPTLGEGLPSRTTTQAKWNAATQKVDPINGISRTFDVTTAKFVLVFQTPGAFNGGTLRPQTVDVTVAANPITHVIDFCYTGQAMQAINFHCDATTINAQPTGSHAACTPDPLYPKICRPLYFIAGFDINGNPICDCKTICEKNQPPNTPP